MLPDMECIGVIERFRLLLPATGIVILTALAIDIFHRALQTLRGMGVLGFITRNSAVEELALAIHAVSQGREFLSDDIAKSLLFPDRRHEVSFILDKLTDRELQVLLLVTQGKRNKEISPLMYISPKTVSTYKQRVYDRLSINNDVQLLHWALHHNLVDRQYPVN
jgi:two-component system invasion response regulator UvrY